MIPLFLNQTLQWFKYPDDYLQINMCARHGLQIQFMLRSLPYSRASLKAAKEDNEFSFLLFTCAGVKLHWLPTECPLLSTS